MKNPYRTTMGQETLDSLSLLCIDADMLCWVDFKDVIKNFALAKSRKMTFWIVYCIAIANVCNGNVKETFACKSVNNTSHNRTFRDCGLYCSVRKPAVDAHRLLRKPPLDVHRPLRPAAWRPTTSPSQPHPLCSVARFATHSQRQLRRPYKTCSSVWHRTMDRR